MNLEDPTINHGVIAPAEGEVSGDLFTPSLRVLAPDSNWDPYITDYEPQYGIYFDSQGCNIFAGTHGIELQLNALKALGWLNSATLAFLYTGQYYSPKADLSERKGCFDAPVTHSGSSEAQWENMSSSKGFVTQADWPFPSEQRTPPFVWEDFYAPPPEALNVKGRALLPFFDIGHRSIGTDVTSIKEALKYAPIKIFVATGTGWNNTEDEPIPANANPMNHAVLVRRVDEQNQLHILDQYAPFVKTLAADYKIFYAFQTIINPRKGLNMVKKFRVDDHGKLGIAIFEGFTGTILFADDMPHYTSLCAAYGIDASTPLIVVP